VTPHPPQFIASLPATLVSQLPSALWSQLPKPALHVEEHLPPAQLGVAWAGAGHVVPHAPQFAESPRVSTSHPFANFPSQSWKPVTHAVILHARAAQLPLATFGPALHDVPHAPQLDALLVRSVAHDPAGSPAQVAFPAGQGGWQVPLVHTSPTPHAAPHAPQLAESLPRLVSQPGRVASQSAKLPAHAAEHAPATQPATWFASAGQALQLAPQCAGSALETQAPPQQCIPVPQSAPSARAAQPDGLASGVSAAAPSSPVLASGSLRAGRHVPSHEQ
jgi:hypothetical protein